MSPPEIRHFLLVPIAGWGHTRPACHLALRLLDCSPNIFVTILAAPILFAKAQAEIAEHLPAYKEPSSRLRVITAFASSAQDVFKIFEGFIASYPTAYKTLTDGKAFTCATTGITYDPVPSPAAVLLDFLLFPVMQATRAITGKSIPIIAWVTGSPLALIRLWGPETLGGLGDLNARVEAEAKRLGAVPDEIGDSVFRKTTGAVVNIPGLPPMYDYEFFPQDLGPLQRSIFPIIKGAYFFLGQSDGVLMSATYALDGGTIPTIKGWFAESKQKVYSVGPLLPQTYWDNVQINQNESEVRIFLDQMQAKHGNNSVVLVSFGSFFWPASQEYVDEVLMALIEKEVPLILSHPSPFAKISPELSALIKSSGISLLSTWVPQQFVLTHPATGWFLTHGGQGSVTEALASGVPLICWPIEGDQPIAAAQLSCSLRAAFELVEVRTGEAGLKPLHRSGRKAEGTREAVGREIREVIDLSRGEVGQEMRKNAQAMQIEMKKSWDEGGVAMKELHEFLAKMP